MNQNTASEAPPATRRALEIRGIALMLVGGNETAVTERVLEIAFQIAKGA